MRIFFAAAAVAAVIFTPAFANCAYPHAPAHLPDGNTATMKQMLAGMKAVSGYNKRMMAYLACIELERGTANGQAGAKLTKKQQAAVDAIEIERHNAAVDQLHAVADQFNAQVRIFKAKHAKSH